MKSHWPARSVCLVPLPTLLCFLYVCLNQPILLLQNQKGWSWVLLDSVALTFLTFIAILGTLVYNFALRNLSGDPHQIRFLCYLGATLWAVQGLAASGNFALFFIFWILTSAGLHQLLQHFHHRPGAVIVAKEKFLISRMGDIALIGAGILIFIQYRTWNFSDWKLIFTHDLHDNVFLIVVLLMIGALTKSAQVPFHAWLPRTLEAPTAVSALMHAGIINAGGYLLIRTYSLVSQSESALAFLILSGLVSTVWGVLAMQMQTDIKRRLAWSTVGQMGFMMIEIGSGLPGLALLHLLGHGLYKADSFLASGRLIPKQSLRSLPSLSRSISSFFLWLVLFLFGTAMVAKLSPNHLLVASLVFVLQLPLIYLAILQRTFTAMLKRLLLALAVAAGSFLLGLSASAWFGLPENIPTEGWRAIVLAISIVVLLFLGILYLFQPWCQNWRWFQWLYSSGLHGFGFGRWPEAFADRFLSRHEGHV